MSVLYLRKKPDPSELQPDVLMAICENVGHSDSGKERPHLNQLPSVMQEFSFFEEHGKLQKSPSAAAFTVSDLMSENLTLRDVVLTITGSYGIAAVVPADFGEANINQHSVKMEINDTILPEYLSVFLNSALCKP